MPGELPLYSKSQPDAEVAKAKVDAARAKDEATRSAIEAATATLKAQQADASRHAAETARHHALAESLRATTAARVVTSGTYITRYLNEAERTADASAGDGLYVVQNTRGIWQRAQGTWTFVGYDAALTLGALLDAEALHANYQERLPLAGEGGWMQSHSSWASIEGIYTWAARIAAHVALDDTLDTADERLDATLALAQAAGLVVPTADNNRGADGVAQGDEDESLHVRIWDGQRMQIKWAGARPGGDKHINRAAFAAQAEVARAIDGTTIVCQAGIYDVAGDPHVSDSIPDTHTMLDFSDTVGCTLTGPKHAYMIRLPERTDSTHGFWDDSAADAGAYYGNQHGIILTNSAGFSLEGVILDGNRASIKLQQLRENQGADLRWKKEADGVTDKLDDKGERIPVYQEHLHAIQAMDASDWQISDCILSNWHGDGIRTFKVAGKVPGYAVDGVTITDVLFSNLGRAGINITRGVRNVTAKGLTFVKVRWSSISCETAGSSAPRDLLFDDVYIDGGHADGGFDGEGGSLHPIAIEGLSSADQLTNVHFRNVTITRSRAGFTVAAIRWAKNVQFTNCIWSGSIRVFASCVNVSWSECHGLVEDTDAETGGNTGGIIVQAEHAGGVTAANRVKGLSWTGGSLEIRSSATTAAFRLQDLSELSLTGARLIGPAGVTSTSAGVVVAQTSGDPRVDEGFDVSGNTIKGFAKGIQFGGSASLQMRGVRASRNFFASSADTALGACIDTGSLTWSDASGGHVPVFVGNSHDGSATGMIGGTGTPGIVQIGGNQGSAAIYQGRGDPNGVLPGGKADQYHRIDGSAGSLIYIKTSSSGIIGWVAYA